VESLKEKVRYFSRPVFRPSTKRKSFGQRNTEFDQQNGRQSKFRILSVIRVTNKMVIIITRLPFGRVIPALTKKDDFVLKVPPNPYSSDKLTVHVGSNSPIVRNVHKRQVRSGPKRSGRAYYPTDREIPLLLIFGTDTG
jgi:hypothetical protein